MFVCFVRAAKFHLNVQIQVDIDQDGFEVNLVELLLSIWTRELFVVACHICNGHPNN